MDSTDKILQLLEGKGFSQAGLAEHIGLAAPNLNKILKRVENRQFKSNQLYLAANYFGVSANYFSSEEEEPIKFVPIVATASCGASEVNVLQDKGMKTAILLKDWNKELYAVIANGDSMATEIYDGDVVVIDPTQPLSSGDMVYYRIDGESAIKVFVDDKENNMYQFVPFNSNEHFKTRSIRLDDDDIENRLIFHKVVQVISSKRNNRAARLKKIGR